MVTRKQFSFFFIALLVLAGLIFIGLRTSVKDVHEVPTSTDQIPNPSLEVDKVTIHEQNSHYTIDAEYPKVNSDAITQYFKNYVEGEIAQFKDDTSWVNDIQSASSVSLTLTISYQSVPSAQVQNYIFTEASYTGGAHGLQVRKTFAFNKEGQLLTVANLFKNGLDGLAPFSKLVQAELQKNDWAKSGWIGDGASPTEGNYQSFIVKDDGLTILFDPYQVAAYAAGAIDITIPLSAFKSFANPDLFATQ